MSHNLGHSNPQCPHMFRRTCKNMYTRHKTLRSYQIYCSLPSTMLFANFLGTQDNNSGKGKHKSASNVQPGILLDNAKLGSKIYFLSPG